MQIAGSKRKEWIRQAREDAQQKKKKKKGGGGVCVCGGGVYLRKAAILR